MSGVIPGVNDVSELTVELVKSWYDSVLGKQPRNLCDRVTEIIKRHTHTANSGDPESSMQEYVFVVMNKL